MSFSTTARFHNHVDRHGLSKIEIQVLYARLRQVLPAGLKVRPEQFDNGRVVGHPHLTKYNSMLLKLLVEVDSRLLDALRDGPLDREALKMVVLGKKPARSEKTFHQFATDLSFSLTGKFAEGSMKNYRVVANKMEEFLPGLKLKSITMKTMQAFEQYLRDLRDPAGDPLNGNNTISKNMQTLKAILNKAADQGLMDRTEFADYKKPTYKQTLPVWLTEAEVDAFYEKVKEEQQNGLKTAGYYFLLSCYTGYRISDAKRFNYREMVQGKKVILRAQKNGAVVSIPFIRNWHRCSSTAESIHSTCHRSGPGSTSKRSARKSASIAT